MAQGHLADNPASDAISAALPNNAQVIHRAALSHPQVSAAVAKVRRSARTAARCEPHFGEYAVYARTELDGTPDLDDLRTRLSFEIG